MENNRRGGYGNRPPQRGGRPYRNDRQDNRPRRPGLPEGFSLFYIALVCPENVETQIKERKEHMRHEYGCVAASKSPAHITIVPPFRAEDEFITNLVDFVEAYNFGIVPFQINLKGYGQFAERVLYVGVEENPELNGLEQDCMKEFSEKFPSILFGMKPEFHAHVTLATRDIPEGKTAEARAFFEAHYPIDLSFEAKELKLLKLENNQWNIK